MHKYAQPGACTMLMPVQAWLSEREVTRSRLQGERQQETGTHIALNARERIMCLIPEQAEGTWCRAYGVEQIGL